VRVLERGGPTPGTPATLVSSPRPRDPQDPFPSPADLLQPPARGPQSAPAAEPPPAAAAWPGQSLGWPKLFGPGNEPPPGPGGGTIDPFKRARAGSATTP